MCDLDLSLPEGSVSLAEEWQVKFRSDNIPIADVYLRDRTPRRWCARDCARPNANGSLL